MQKIKNNYFKELGKDFAVDTFVTPDFREFILSKFPAVKDNPAYFKLLSVLLFSTNHEKDTGRLILPYKILASIEDKRLQCEQKKYRSLEFLDHFNDDILKPAHKYDHI